MMLRLVLAAGIAFGAVNVAFAQTTPDFLKNRTYATSPDQCKSTGSSADELQLSEYGVFGLEFGCQFLGFAHDKDPESGQIYVSVATANCGDDSGINRPDLITLVNNLEQGEVVVQSQNEYNLGEALGLIGRKTGLETTQEPQNFVSRTYKLCK